MAEQFNPLDPLGIFGQVRKAPLEVLRRDLERIKAAVDSTVNPLNPVKKDVDRIAARAKLPSLPGPPEERAAKHQAAYGEPLPARGTGFQRLLDPLRLFRSISNPIPVEFDRRLVELKEQARSNLIAAGYPAPLVNRALTWYDEWLMGMARILAPSNIELQRSAVQSAYAEIAPKAESWMRGIQKAFGITELRVEENLLTTTEHEVLRLAAEGLSNREIAERLFITPGTVRVHLSDIRRRIGVATTEEAVAAFGKPTERERVPISLLRLPRVTIAPYERRAAGLLPLVDELERSPSMGTVGILEDELHDLVGEVIGARALTSGIEAAKFSDLHARLAFTIQDVVLVRAAIESMERGLIRDPWTGEIRPIRPMEKEAARRDFLSMIQDLRKNLMG